MKDNWSHLIKNELGFKDPLDINKIIIFLEEVNKNSKNWEEICGMLRILKKIKLDIDSIWLESDLIQNIRDNKINDLIETESYKLVKIEEVIKYSSDLLISSGYSGSSNEMIYFDCVDLVIKSILTNDKLSKIYLTPKSIQVENNTFTFSFYQKI
jgi:hypothetical protein